MPEQYVHHVELEIDEEMIWAVKIEDGSVRVYLNETDTLTFSEKAVLALWKSLFTIYGGK